MLVWLEPDAKGDGACSLRAAAAPAPCARMFLSRAAKSQPHAGRHEPRSLGVSSVCAVSKPSGDHWKKAQRMKPSRCLPATEERNRDRLRPGVVCHAAWNAAISAAADWRETVAAGASGAS